jgi:DHA2 family multidrug resistance protein
MLQTLMGYSPTMAGLVMSPAGLFTILEMPLVGILLGRKVDARWLIIAGLTIVSTACFWMSSLNLEVGPSQVLLPRIVQTLGAGLLWVPINTAAYLYVPKDQTNNASSLFNLIRNEGSSLGVALVTTLLQRCNQFHQNVLIGHITPLNPLATWTRQHLSGGPGGLASGSWVGLARIYEQVQTQAQILSYLDIYRLFAVASLAVIPLVLLMRRSVARGGAAAAH